ncbi:MAG: PDZ domain-containing protein [Vicinamibacterales bacterium]
MGCNGSSVHDRSRDRPLPECCCLTKTRNNSRASELPLTSGDVIHAVNGAWVTTPAELREALARCETGDAFVLQVERNGELTYPAFDME